MDEHLVSGTKILVSEGNYFLLSITVAVLAVLISLVIFLFSRKSSRQSILLIGLSESGKTTLFTQLAYDSFASTVTSMKENEAPITLKNNKTLVLFDLPGFDRLRNQYWDKFKSRAKGIIFVVDSLNFMSNVHNVADLLYQYLCDSFVVSNRIPVLIACTKQDETRAKSARVISSMLEKEFNTIRETRMGALDTTSGDDNRIQLLGNPDNPFKFGDLRNSIDFADCSCWKEQKNLDNIFSWINSIA